MGRQKGSGEGSIFKSGNRWRGQIMLGDERRSVSGKTKKEVVDKLAELRVKYNFGEYAKRNDVTLKEWCEYWLEAQVKPNITEQSYLGTEALFRNHLYDVLGDYTIQSLNRKSIEEAYSIMFPRRKVGSYKNIEYAQSTVDTLSIHLKKCLQYAVDSGVLASNPCKNIKAPAWYREPKKVSAYTNADQEKIIRESKYGKLHLHVFYFLISTGMRFGEAAALTWDDIDLDTGMININKTAVMLHGSMFIQDKTKTKSGIRTIFVGANVIEWLKWHKSQLDPKKNIKNLAFPNTHYNIMNLANNVKTWQRFQVRIGVEHKGIHALRHTWATRALENGVNVKVVSHMLGHKNIVTTMNIYQDVFDNEKQKAASILNDLF